MSWACFPATPRPRYPGSEFRHYKAITTSSKTAPNAITIVYAGQLREAGIDVGAVQNQPQEEAGLMVPVAVRGEARLAASANAR